MLELPVESDEAPPALADVVDEPVSALVEFAVAVPIEPVLSPEALLFCAPPADSAALPEVAVPLLEELSADPLFIVLVLALLFDAALDPESSEEHPPSTNSAAAESPSGAANDLLIPIFPRFSILATSVATSTSRSSHPIISEIAPCCLLCQSPTISLAIRNACIARSSS